MECQITSINANWNIYIYLASRSDLPSVLRLTGYLAVSELGSGEAELNPRDRQVGSHNHWRKKKQKIC